VRSTVAAVESRGLLALLILAGGLLLLLCALVERPHADPGAGDHAFRLPFVQIALAAEEPATTASAADEEGHAPVAESDGHAASPAAGAGHDEPDTHEEDRGAFLGVDLDRVNLTAPRASMIVIACSFALAALLLIRPAGAGQVATLIVGSAGVLVSLIEASDAGEELGIFVPLPLLAAVLYGGAVGLAALGLIETRHERPLHA
jgi:hypothetical protein